jgi:hypothetical protein
MPDWALYDPQLRQFHADGVTSAEMARRVNLPPQTVRDRLIKLGLLTTRPKTKKSPRPEGTMPDDVVKVLPGQISLNDADTPGEVHYGAVSEFDAIPEGYAKTIQPMREYTEAEEWALNKSMELYGFIGTIVRDQYGRILDGNQRERVARLRALAVPYTITHVRDDAHAMEIATSLNAVRRHYTAEQRQELAPILRDQGFSYRAIAEALGVGKSTVYRDVFGQLRIRPEPVIDTEIVPNGTLPVVSTEAPTQGGDSDANDHAEIVPHGTMPEINHAERDVAAPPANPPQRVKRKGGGTYPAQRPTGTTFTGKGQAEQTRERMGERGGPNLSWINVLSHANRLCSSLRRLPDLDEILESWGPEGREKAMGYLRPLQGNIQQLVSRLEAHGAGGAISPTTEV